MRNRRGPWLAAGAAASLLITAAFPRTARSDVFADPSPLRATREIRLLSYNVEGLPWPFTHGREGAARQIAAQLQSLRERDEGPTIVAVQEAFGVAQKAIGAAAGYRYVAYGPSASMGSLAPSTADELTYSSGASTIHGETEGVWEDSGLAIFSDYPIVWVGRTAFPRYACAGYDCLANKGILAVALRVPGSTDPLVVVDTHLNSRSASGVNDARSLAAYRRQVDILKEGISRLARLRWPVLLAGDFNVGNDPAREAYLSNALNGVDRMKVGASEMTCGTSCRVIATIPAVARSKTIIFYRGATAAVEAGRSFGFTPGGRRLSDHVGVVQTFHLKA